MHSLYNWYDFNRTHLVENLENEAASFRAGMGTQSSMIVYYYGNNSCKHAGKEFQGRD